MSATFKPEHFRIIGYAITLAMHGANSIACKLRLQGDVMEDVRVQQMVFLETCYFTVWNITMQLVYCAFGLYCDITALKGNGKSEVYMKFRKTFFNAVLWPSTMFTFCLFWPMFLYDRNVIYPEFMDGVFTKNANNIMHLWILPVILWEAFFMPFTVPTSHKKNLVIINCVSTTYLIWSIYMSSIISVWPYPILNNIDGTIYLPLFFLAAHLFMNICYYTQWFIIPHTGKSENKNKQT